MNKPNHYNDGTHHMNEMEGEWNENQNGITKEWND